MNFASSSPPGPYLIQQLSEADLLLYSTRERRVIYQGYFIAFAIFHVYIKTKIASIELSVWKPVKKVGIILVALLQDRLRFFKPVEFFGCVSPIPLWVINGPSILFSVRAKFSMDVVDVKRWLCIFILVQFCKRSKHVWVYCRGSAGRTSAIAAEKIRKAERRQTGTSTR